jgi:cytochrome c553
MSENADLSEEDIKALADYFSVLIEIEQDLKVRGIKLDDI